MSRLEKGINDFETWCLNNGKTDMLKEWDYEKNAPILPCDVAYGTAKKFWWIGLYCGHSYNASMNRRTSENTACPYCCDSHAKLLKGFNDLATRYPDIAKQWHPTNNGHLMPNQVVSGSGKKVWWQCKDGHEWEATIVNRTRCQTQCPTCQNRKRNSSHF